MHEASVLLNEANKQLRTADHLAYVTYPLVKDNKLMITITESLAEATKKAVDAVLLYDRDYKRIMSIPQDFQSKLEIFKKSCMPRYSISSSYLNLIYDLKEIQDARKTAKMEFTRQDKYVLSQDNFKLRTLTYLNIKNYVTLTKSFFEKINSIFKNVQT